MTQRELINVALKKSVTILVLALVFALIGIIALQVLDKTIAIWIPIIAFALVPAFFFRIMNIKCVKCGTPFGSVLNARKRINVFIKISESLKYCPFCGVSLDDEIKEPRSNKRLQGDAAPPRA
jgi:hypothetical protein